MPRLSPPCLLKPHATWHLDEVYLKIDGRMAYLWRAIDAEVLDVLVQSKRNKHVALKLMRKLLRKYAFVPERFPAEGIDQAIWLYLRFTLSFRDVEDLLAERGIVWISWLRSS